MNVTIAPHPTLRVAAFATTYPRAIAGIVSQSAQAFLRADARAPLQRDEHLRAAIRDMLRHGGYKPTGRGKPASEYLVRAAEEGALGSINVAVDVCNAVSLHSGFPITVVDLDRAHEPFSVAIAGEGSTYVFNASGQEIDLAGLMCLFDRDGPCGNAVRDSQRTKTTPETTRTLSVVWGCAGFEERLAAAEAWYRSLLTECGATTDRASFG